MENQDNNVLKEDEEDLNNEETYGFRFLLKATNAPKAYSTTAKKKASLSLLLP
jgi:hypothetical protein